MFVAVVLYAVVGIFITPSMPQPTEELQSIFRIISFLGGLCVAGLLLIRNLIGRALASPDEESEEPQPSTVPGAKFMRVRRLTLVAFVLSEMIALLGLLFVLMGGHLRTLYIFCAISLACLILFFPRETN
jgi:hypothetical protein